MEEGPKKEGSVYGVISVIAWFALALFWSVDSSFRWIFFGIAIGFGIVYLLKSGAFNFRLTDFFQQTQQTSRYNAPQIGALTTSQKGALYFGVGTLLAMAMAFVIYAVSTGFETEENDGQSLEITPESTSTEESNADVLLETGNNFYNNSQLDSALVYYKHALSLRPGYKEAYYNIALIYSSRSDYANAILTLEECLQSHPDYGDGLQLMGNCYSRQEKQEEALQFYERAYATGLRNAELSHYLAYLYDLKNNTSKAIEFYREAIEQDSSKVDVYKRLAELDSERAEWYIKKAEEGSAK